MLAYTYTKFGQDVSTGVLLVRDIGFLVT